VSATAKPFPETSNSPADGEDANKKIAPVTGAGSGIGLAASQWLAQGWHHVEMAGHRPETLNLWRRALVRWHLRGHEHLRLRMRCDWF